MIKLDLLRAFVVISRHGGLKDAANELGRTQSALSMKLAQLEGQLGGALFETDRKKELTNLGRYVRDRAEELLRENDRLQELISDYAKGYSGRLRIASVPSVAALILPNLLRDFMAQHHSAEVEVTDSDSVSVHKMIERGHSDLGIAGPAPSEQALQKTALFKDRLHVVCLSSSRLASSDGPLRWKDLDGSELIANETLKDIDSPMAQALHADSKLSARNVSSLFAMVQSGLGYTVLPGLATRQLAEPLVAIPMEHRTCDREISLLMHGARTHSPIVREFQGFLLAHLPDVASKLGLAVAEK